MAAARTGVSRLGLIDPDPVELSNLHRQVIYAVSDIGTPKVTAAERRLR
jgi:adenylyltransferase/sulfurtransferase